MTASRNGERSPDYLPGDLVGRPDFIAACERQDLGEVFRAAVDFGFPVSHLARRCEMSIGQVQSYMRNGRRPTGPVLARVSDGLHIPGRMLAVGLRPWEGKPAGDGNKKAAGILHAKNCVYGDPPIEHKEISLAPVYISSYIPSANGQADGADTLEVNDVERRELLKIMGGMAMAAPLYGRVDADTVRRKLDSALNARTAKSDVEEWERVASQYSTESGLVAPSLLLPELLSDLDEAQQRLSDSPESLRAPMARVCGYLSALAACNFFNAGDEKDARRYWRTALRLIGQSGDRSAQAELYADRASFTLLEAHSSPSAALSLADDAISVSGNVPCAGTANGYAARAMALALLGNHRESARAVRDLADTFTRMPGAQTTAYSSWGYSEQQLHFVEGLVFAYAGRASDATKALDSGLSLVPADQWIAVTSFEVNRAIALIRGGDPSEGARHVARAVRALPSGYRQSATMRRASFAMESIPASAANVPAVAEARELLSLSQGAEA